MKDHIIKIRVRYADTDKMGVMYYSNYLIWFEVARTGLFREAGFVYSDIERTRNIYLPVVEACCKYKAPLRYDDQAEIITNISDLGKTRLTFEYKIINNGRQVTSGYTKHAFVDGLSKLLPIPDDIKNALKVYSDQ